MKRPAPLSLLLCAIVLTLAPFGAAHAQGFPDPNSAPKPAEAWTDNNGVRHVPCDCKDGFEPTASNTRCVAKPGSDRSRQQAADRRRAAARAACQPLDWQLKEAIDPDLLAKPLDVTGTLCAQRKSANCLRFSRLLSSIPHAEFKQFVKSKVRFVVMGHSNTINSPMTSSCKNPETPIFDQCVVSIYPEFWKIENETAQELVLILETGKIASLNKVKFSGLRPAVAVHKQCLGSIYNTSTSLLSDAVDDSALGLDVIGTIPVKRRH